MKKRIRVGILFGGRSAEHEISLLSAKNIIQAIDKEKYEPVLIGIDKKGKWYLEEQSHFLLNANNPKLISLNKSHTSVALTPWKENRNLRSLSKQTLDLAIDVVFPVLHGPYGEDGTIQGLLKLAGIPFVGASVAGSAIGMDKDVMKRLLREAGIPVAKFLVLKKSDVILEGVQRPIESQGGDPIASLQDDNKFDYKTIVNQLGLPFFVKPANLGSSVGISKVYKKAEFKSAIKEAFQYDNKILIEQFIEGREIECSVLGNDDPIASLPGEVIPSHEFYSYEAKYIDENGAKLIIPAKLPEFVIKQVQKLAIYAFKILCAEGMARVDFFLAKNGKLYVNEINTIPGFTKISMYPKLWEVSGISYTELIDRLIQLAIERFERESKLKTTVE
ncbi:MAG: D-alanine--D-alanine ligase [Candidatus Levybacteria bacterium]|nr:D-alanine--D-alanine ligase [Candidatus Levybacteria bacterium]